MLNHFTDRDQIEPLTELHVEQRIRNVNSVFVDSISDALRTRGLGNIEAVRVVASICQRRYARAIETTNLQCFRSDWTVPLDQVDVRGPLSLHLLERTIGSHEVMCVVG